MTHLAERLARVQTSPSMIVASRAAKMRAEGHDIISLSVGEPDFDTPDHIKAAAKMAIDRGETKYTPLHGTPALREAIVQKFARDNQLNYDLDNILVTAGGKQGCYNLIMALVSAGDEVIIPTPYWVSYPDMVKLADGKPVWLPTTEQHQYKITAESLATKLTERTRCLIINSPSNPTGSAYTYDELAAIGEVLQDYPDVIILSDDIYEPIMWSEAPFMNLAMVCPDLKSRVVIVNGVSKAYAMTGWRIGYTAADEALTSAMATIQSQCSSNACSISQAAAVAALNGPQDMINTMRSAYQSRYELVYQRLNNFDGVSMPRSDGAFYGFANCHKLIQDLDGIDDDVSLCEILLQNGVALVPGSAFGQPDCIRFSYAADEASITTALDRIEAVIRQYQYK